MKKKIVVMCQSGFSADRSLKQAMEMAMVIAAHDFELSFFFRGEGVLCLLPQIDLPPILLKSDEKLLAMAELCDIDKVYVCQKSAENLGLKAEQLPKQVVLVDSKTSAQFFEEADLVLSYP